MNIKKKLLTLIPLLTLSGFIVSGYQPSIDVDLNQKTVIVTNSATVYADSNVKPFIILDSDSGVSSVVENINHQINTELSGVKGVTGAWQFLRFDSGKKRVELDKQRFAELSLSARRKVMNIALEQLGDENSGGLGERDRARLYNFVQSQDKEIARVLQTINTDVKADIAYGMRVMSYIKSPVANFLGVVVILISVMVGLQIALDVFMMTTPPAMHWALNKYGNKRPSFISPEAWHSYKESATSNVYKDYFLTYITRSVPKLLLTGVCLAYIIAGNVVYLALFFANLFAR